MDPLQGLWDQVRAFWEARTVLTAMELDVFTQVDALGDGATGVGLARRLEASERGTALLLEALWGLGLLTRRGAVYRNGDLAARHLVAGRPGFRGGVLLHAASLWPRWSQLTACVRSGQPARCSFEGDEGRSFMLAMHHGKVDGARRFAAALPLTGGERVLDVGGGSGVLSQAIAEGDPEARVTLFDRPYALAVAREVLPAALLDEGRIELRSGDFLQDDLGSGYDLVLLSSIIHMLSPAATLGLLVQARHALGCGGRIAIREFYLQDDGPGPAFGALFSLNMLVNTAGGRSYRAKEVAELLARAGFGAPRRIDLPGPADLLVAHILQEPDAQPAPDR